jgi:hypothetical protein
MANPNQKARNGRGHYVRTLETTERDAKAAHLHGHGYTYGMIVERLGYPSINAAKEGVRKIINAAEREPANELLAIELARLDAELVRLRQLEKLVYAVLEREHITVSNGRVILDPRTETPLEDDSPVLQSADRLIRIEDARRRNGERRAKLLGLEAAVKVDTTVHEVKQEDIELAELIREAQAKNAAEEAQIKGGNPE